MATGTCPSCKRPFAPADIGAVTEDTAKFCIGTGTPACIAWTRKITTEPGEPLPNAFGMSDKTKAKIGRAAAVGAGLAAVFGAFFAIVKALEPAPRGRGRR